MNSKVKVRILSVGKMKEPYLEAAEEELRKRLRPFMTLELVETGTVKGGGLTPEQVMREEGKAVLGRLKDGELFIALDERGRTFESEGFAEFLRKKMVGGTSSFVFGVGGPFGWAPEVKERADLLLSLSSLTFPYQIARLILIEQLYRSATLWNNIPYHKGQPRSA